MIVGELPPGCIYTIFYSAWKTNLKCYVFVLYCGPACDKMHALNLGARQLNAMDRAQLFAIIRRLGTVPGHKYMKGLMLYRLFKTFARGPIRKCYRTYFKDKITRASLLNYGIYKEGELPVQTFVTMKFDRQLLADAQRDAVVKLLNTNQRGYQLSMAKGSMAKPSTSKIPPKNTPSTKPGSTNQTGTKKAVMSVPAKKTGTPWSAVVHHDAPDGKQ